MSLTRAVWDTGVFDRARFDVLNPRHEQSIRPIQRSLTRHQLIYVKRDSTTGGWTPEYMESSINGVLYKRSAGVVGFPSGVVMTLDAVLECLDGVEQGDLIEDGSEWYYVESTIEHIDPATDSFARRFCQLRLRQLHRKGR